jgi:vacuolar-type H+-ATPase catalytic subunit A/Vma1
MENIFDGIQRPLQVIFDKAGQSPFVPLGVDVPALDGGKKYWYRAHKCVAVLVGGLRQAAS